MSVTKIDGMQPKYSHEYSSFPILEPFLAGSVCTFGFGQLRLWAGLSGKTGDFFFLGGGGGGFVLTARIKILMEFTARRWGRDG